MVSPDDIDDLWTKPAKMSRVVTRMRAGKDAKPSATADVQQQHEQNGSGSGELEQPADARTEQQRHMVAGLRPALDPAAPDASPSKAGSAAASRQNSDEKPEPAGASPSRPDALARESPTPRHPDGAHITGGDYRRVRPVPRQSASVPHGIGGSGGPQHGPDVNSRRLRPIKTAPPKTPVNGDDDTAQVLFWKICMSQTCYSHRQFSTARALLTARLIILPFTDEKLSCASARHKRILPRMFILGLPS